MEKNSDKTVAKRANPELWEQCKADGITKMGGKFSARAMQYAVKLYEDRGGKYIGKKDPHNSLSEWTEEGWGYTGEAKHSRYLPEKARQALTASEKAATSRAKNEGTKKGQQWVPQPKAIAEKTKKYRQHN
jgi:hypothetical protein